MNTTQQKQLTFWSTINREETQFCADMTSPPTGAMMDCTVMTGVHKGETRPFRWLNLNTLWQQQTESDQ